MTASTRIFNVNDGVIPRNVLYVGRPHPLGNPYSIGLLDGDRDTVIEKYAIWLDARILEKDPVVCTALLGIRPDQSLACHCAPKHCHAEIILQALASPEVAALRSAQNRSRTMRYAGIGSRNTPMDMLQQMQLIASWLESRGYRLLSGGAAGADTAFEMGAGSNKEIYLPWPGFNEHTGAGVIDLPTAEARRVAALVHPAGDKMGDKVLAFMARNSHQVLGANLRSPVDFVLCWTADGCETEVRRTRATGGTGQAIALADRWGVPVINLIHGQSAIDRMNAIVL
ncbi:DUF4326 domain-containing protein [Acidithiobacillus ferrivorans]|uniref:DUF4326 domain-containing protein n=1 Tax=Acidithiobacillus ferrivorans TaxID=160808 RepID=UPI0009F6E5E7|nr:DUF4326 domain-containing protein [Acidithiobacillus ferrivorans]